METQEMINPETLFNSLVVLEKKIPTFCSTLEHISYISGRFSYRDHYKLFISSFHIIDETFIWRWEEKFTSMEECAKNYEISMNEMHTNMLSLLDPPAQSAVITFFTYYPHCLPLALKDKEVHTWIPFPEILARVRRGHIATSEELKKEIYCSLISHQQIEKLVDKVIPNKHISLPTPELSVKRMKFYPRTIRLLIKNGIPTLSVLLSKKKDDLMSISGLGKKTLADVVEGLATFNLVLQQDEAEVLHHTHRIQCQLKEIMNLQDMEKRKPETRGFLKELDSLLGQLLLGDED